MLVCIAELNASKAFTILKLKCEIKLIRKIDFVTLLFKRLIFCHSYAGLF